MIFCKTVRRLSSLNLTSKSSGDCTFLCQIYSASLGYTASNDLSLEIDVYLVEISVFRGIAHLDVLRI
jgi:hypothetical protein